ncbi:MAG: acetyl-CoA carboxylase, carboxyltransferase subunit beta [Candidatus Caenarcaniphilales bacterium]|nr:acetyl-CoA carboxylase, carboxyltransferase subunit beta [Candidatus Caenarcaniphilales bacterium]
MSLKDLFKFRKQRPRRTSPQTELMSEEDISELWTQCPACKTVNYNADLKANLKVCKNCQHHFRISSYERIEFLIDAGSWDELNGNIRPSDPLNFVDLKPYTRSLEDAKKRAGTTEAIVTGVGKIQGYDLALGVMEFAFLGGSMGSVVGERIACLVDTAIERKLPLILVSSSGGARMHEGLFSLMQMAKTATALAQLKKAGQLYISVLADPTYGGVSASYAMLGDIIIAEPGAKIGFAGPRVIEETIRQKLPKDFQTSEYMLEHGQIDLVIPRKELKSQITQLIRLHQPNNYHQDPHPTKQVEQVHG